MTGVRTGRLTSIDTLRGIVMILMALDHVRDFFGVPGVSPTNVRIAEPRLVSVYGPSWLGCRPAVHLLLWALVVALLYPACRWYASLKQRRTDAWLTYF